MTTVFALLGVTALYLLIAWLISAIVAQDLSDLKAYGEKAGLATGLLLSGVAVVIWLAWPAKRGSSWDRRVKLPDLVLAAAALVVILSVLLLKWFSGGGGDKFFDEAAPYDVLLPIGAAVAYAVLHARARGAGPTWLGAAAAGGAAIAVVVTLLQAFDKPDGASLTIGFFVCLVASLVALGAALAALRVDRTAGAASTMAEARSQAAEAT